MRPKEGARIENASRKERRRRHATESVGGGIENSLSLCLTWYSVVSRRFMKREVFLNESSLNIRETEGLLERTFP